jgi:hypothetical protein
MSDIQLNCTCGKVKGVIKNVNPQKTNRGICLCDDCQAFAHFLGRAADILDKNGGTDILPTPPSDIHITQGSEQLKCMRLGEKGMLRFYTDCCKTPVANLMPIKKMPFAGVPTLVINVPSAQKDEAIGPVQTTFFAKYGIGPLPPGARNTPPLGFLFRTVKFIVGGFLKGKYAPSPFYDLKTGEPAAKPHILSRAERDRLRPLCGPQ